MCARKCVFLTAHVAMACVCVCVCVSVYVRAHVRVCAMCVCGVYVRACGVRVTLIPAQVAPSGHSGIVGT